MKHSIGRLQELERSLALEFSDISLLQQALVHSSFISEFPGVFPESNERLEFLGDSVLDLVVAQELVARFPDRPEGQLTQMRASLVDRTSLAAVGGRLDLGAWLVMGRGEFERGWAERESNLADAFEALLAAVFLDQGYQNARDYVLRVMGAELDSVADADGPMRHPKSLLHEAAMERGYSPPVYREIARTGPDHAPTFTVQALLDGKPIGAGEGRSRQDAEACAAASALRELGR